MQVAFLTRHRDVNATVTSSVFYLNVFSLSIRKSSSSWSVVSISVDRPLNLYKIQILPLVRRLRGLSKTWHHLLSLGEASRCGIVSHLGRLQVKEIKLSEYLL